MSVNASLEREYATLAQKTADALVGLQGAIKDINDTNVLHLQFQQEQIKAIGNIEKFWGRIVFILVIAVAILAGLEKFGKLLGL